MTASARRCPGVGAGATRLGGAWGRAWGGAAWRTRREGTELDWAGRGALRQRHTTQPTFLQARYTIAMTPQNKVCRTNSRAHQGRFGRNR